MSESSVRNVVGFDGGCAGASRDDLFEVVFRRQDSHGDIPSSRRCCVVSASHDRKSCSASH